ncbi:hypothetical protein PLANTIT3_61540 [Plantibacter sp. T3]|nr:hypothetical protein PLANTIT3_61540 [Plantibacter sp. T3]
MSPGNLRFPGLIFLAPHQSLCITVDTNRESLLQLCVDLAQVAIIWGVVGWVCVEASISHDQGLDPRDGEEVPQWDRARCTCSACLIATKQLFTRAYVRAMGGRLNHTRKSVVRKFDFNSIIDRVIDGCHGKPSLSVVVELQPPAPCLARAVTLHHRAGGLCCAGLQHTIGCPWSSGKVVACLRKRKPASGDVESAQTERSKG